MHCDGIKHFSCLAILIWIGTCCAQNGMIPEPHLIIIGPVGVGKSSLANVLIGQPPDGDNCTFAVCSDDLCTKETKYAVGKWKGNADQEFTIVDTPGFGYYYGSISEYNIMVNEMVDTFKNYLKTANGFLLVFNGNSDRFNEGATQMIREIEALFGKSFWDHVILGVSHWAYDQKSVYQRNITHEDESWWMDETNKQLKARFHLKKDLDTVFIDSWSQQNWNIEDDLQQVAYQRETKKLWDSFSVMDSFEFKTVEELAEELQACKLELEYCYEQCL